MADETVFQAGTDIEVGDLVTWERTIRRRWWQFWRPRRVAVVERYRCTDKLTWPAEQLTIAPE